MEDIRVAIRKRMAAKGYSHAAIARKAGMDPKKLSAVLTLRRRLEANELLALCDAMETDTAKLLSGE